MKIGDCLRFELKAECVFSGDVERVRGDIETVVLGSSPILKKGAPRGKESEAARIKSWRVGGNKLEFTIESGRYVRAHDALFRLTKALSAELGKKHRLGLRQIRVPEYRIILPPAELSEQTKTMLKKMSCEFNVDKRGICLFLRDLSGADLKQRVVDRLVTMIEESLAHTPVRVVETKIVKIGQPVEHPFKEDPFEVAKKLGWIKDFPGRGQWVYTAPYVKLLQALEDIVVERIVLPLGFEEAMFPKLIPLEVMQRMPGYLDGVPEGMYYVCPPPREPEAFEDFKQQLKLRKKLPVDELEKVIKRPSYVLAPAQCEPFYEIFNRRSVRIEDLPIKAFDRSGWTYRWEGGGVEGIVRTQEFRRIELVYLGKPVDVVAIRDSIRDKSIEVVSELSLEWRLSVATPFYMREGSVGRDIDDSNRVATYDLEVKLPYKDDWLELGSFNVHRTKFVETFKIKEIKEREIWTGCCGFGSTRWAAGFLAQYGFDPANWPKQVRQRVEPLPSPLKVME